MENIQEKLIIKKGTKLVTKCVDLNHEGQGVCKIEGIKDSEEVTNFPIFVNNMIPDEKGQIEITKLSKTYGYANVVKVFNDTRSKNRTRPLCPNYEKCGGCNIMHMSYPYQLEFKTKMVKFTSVKLGEKTDSKEYGTIWGFFPDKGLGVVAKGGIIYVEEFQFESSKKMKVSEYLKGHEIVSGDYFSSERA